MKKSMLKAVASIIAVFTVIACFSAIFTSCTGKNDETTSAVQTSADEQSTVAEQPTAAAEKTGEGATLFYLTVTFADGTQKDYEISTDEKTVGAALTKLNLVEGTEGEYGLYINAVAGVTADYATDGTYWAFYVNGEYALTGVDKTDITPGEHYELKVEKG